MVKITDYFDREDGGADFTLELNKNEVEILIQDAIKRALQDYIMFEALKDIDND